MFLLSGCRAKTAGQRMAEIFHKLSCYLQEYVECSEIIMKNCYDVLGCSPVASYSELKEAYFSKLRTNHPDKGGSSSALFLVTKAWSILKLVL